MAPIQMNSIRQQSKMLCQLFSLSDFTSMLGQRDLFSEKSNFEDYVKHGFFHPFRRQDIDFFHRGHMLLLLRLKYCSDLHYQPLIMKGCDVEDIMSRRVFLSELEAEQIADDIERVEQFFAWLQGDNAGTPNIQNAVHTKALVDLMLDILDPHGFYETLHSDNSMGVLGLIHELITIQSEITAIVGIASDAGISVPNVQYVFERKRSIDEKKALLLPFHSPFLAIPTRDVMVEERLEFMDKRNRLLADGKYRELVDFYESNIYLFEPEVERHAAVCACLGHIYGDLLHDSAKAAEAFGEAIEYDSGNEDAFREISRHLRAAEKWDELVVLLSNHWDTIDDTDKRCELILECARIQAFKCQNVHEAIGLYERCLLEGHPGNEFDDIYKIIVGLMDECTDLERLRALVTLSMHITNFPQCDKVESLLKKWSDTNETTGTCLVRLVEAGILSYKGDQSGALESLRDAISESPNNTLIDGVLLRIARKTATVAEFRSVIDDLESESLSSSDLATLWLRIARVLAKLHTQDTLALEYAERAVNTHVDFADAIDFCYELAKRIQLPERALIYATLKCAREKDSTKKAEWEKTCNDLKKSLNNDADKLLSAYETLLQFDAVKNETGDDLKELILSVSDDKAITILQRIESIGMSSGMTGLVGDLYRSVLERDIDDEQKKNVLERYVGFLYGQIANIDIDLFISAHAQLYVLVPSDRLFTMIKTVAKDNIGAIRKWTGALEDALPDIEDTNRIVKIHMALAGCYQSILKDPEKTAESFACILKLAPDNAPIFKCCYNAYERLERYYDCVEIARNFPHENLSEQECLTYSVKSLNHALIHLLDVDAMQYFIDLIAREDEAVIPEVLTQLVDKAKAADVDMSQLVCFLEQIEKNSAGRTALSMRLTRAGLLVELGRTDEALPLLDEDTYAAAKDTPIFSDGIAIVQTLDTSDAECKKVFNRWNGIVSIAPAPKAIDENDWISRAAQDGIVSEVEAAIATLSADEKTRICLRLGAAAESAQAIANAEEFYKRAFAYTQNFELLEFYRRNRHFKRALKILRFKLAKAPEAAKNGVKLELAMVYDQLGDFQNSVAVLDDILANRDGLDKATVLAVMRQKAADLGALGHQDEAADVLAAASAEADDDTRNEIDIDRCLLMRENAHDDALKLYQSLCARNLQSEKMDLLSLCFDIDAGNYEDARKKIDTLANSANLIIRIPALEKCIQLQQKCGDDEDAIRKTAQRLLEIAPDSVIANQVLA